ncbi:MAG TPA: DUF3300 domain-containing protein [Bryobacteraceae bacterium]
MFRHQSQLLRVMAVVSAALLAPGDVRLMGQGPAPTPDAPNAAPDASKSKTADELDSLVAPIALYPDPLLGQVLAASTYPLDIVQADRWLKANSTLQGENLTQAAAKQPWDPSVQALVAFPSALRLLDDNIKWTTDLGNAVLDQQNEVMDAVQRMREKAKESGKLETTKEQEVEVKTVDSKTVIEIQPANPEVIYVPSYNPAVVYGPPAYPSYPYPPIYYPPGAYVAGAAISFGAGVALGAFWGGCCGGGGWGWGTSWGHVNNININNNFNNRYGYANNVGNRGNGNWQHNPQHRQGVPYDNRDTAQRFGGSAREPGGGSQRFDRSGQPRQSLGDRGGPGGDRGGLGGSGGGLGGDRGGLAGGSQVGNRDLGGNRGGGGLGGGGGDRVGNRSISGQGGQGSAFGGGESRARTQSSSNRGFSSSRGSGGGFGGGGGGSRGGGGRRR